MQIASRDQRSEKKCAAQRLTSGFIEFFGCSGRTGPVACLLVNVCVVVVVVVVVVEVISVFVSSVEVKSQHAYPVENLGIESFFLDAAPCRRHTAASQPFLLSPFSSSVVFDFAER